jgi:hypothetical protein
MSLSEDNQDDLLQHLLSLYKQLDIVQQKQLSLLQEDESEVQWASLQSLIEQWDILSRSADGLVSQDQIAEWRSNPISKHKLSVMDSMLHKMEECSQMIQAKIQLMSKNMSEDIQGLKKHQTVLHAYGGLDRPNLESMYFDEKK